jgi:Flp pilus assembly protein TadD
MSKVRQMSQLLQQAVDQGNTDRVAQLTEQKLRRSPNDGRLHEEMGLAFCQVKQFSRAQELLELAQLMVPLKPEAELALAECHMASDSSDLAIGLLENVGTRKSVSTHVLLHAAAVLERLGRFNTAWQTCRRAVRESPDDAQTWFALSFYMRRLRFPFSKIEAVCQRAIDLAPDNVVFRISLATALSRLGREQNAYAVIRRFGAKELEQICCSSGIESIRLLFESADDWRGVCLCNEQLVLRSLNRNSDCCGGAGSGADT